MVRGLLIPLALLLSSAASAQQLTLEEAVTAALARHPSVAQAEAGAARAAAGVRESRAALLPSATAEGLAMRYQEPMVVAPLHGFDPASPPVFDRTLLQANVGLSYTAFDGGARGAPTARSELLYDAAHAALDGARETLIADVARRYGGVVVARELVAAHGARVDALEEERQRAAQLLEQGRAARVVLLRAEAALSAARAGHASAVSDAELAERDLARLTGIDARTIATAELPPVAVRDDDVARDALLAAAVRGSPELRRLRSAVEAADATVAEATAQRWPRVQLGGRYVQYASGAGSAGGEWQTGVQLSYPLFTAGARPAAEQRARAEWELSRAELSLGELRIAEAIDRALVAASSARAREMAWDAAVTQNEEVMRIERLALDAGAGVQTDYLAAHAELLRARAALAEARYARFVARVELARAIGELTPAWLAANLEPVR
jgi:outer membrane protein